MKTKLLIPGLLFIIFVLTQQYSYAQTDTAFSSTLQEVQVKAYQQNRKLTEVPAAISLVGQAQLTRFNNTSILPAVNMNPGVRMEERSPGSYRFNIRGSSIRSPFGVRDVKVYWNDIPLTDPGGNTYLNELGFYNIQSMEIIKGPAASLYGANIGGALLIKSMPNNWQKGTNVDLLYGSFNTKSLNVNVRAGDADHENSFSYSHQSSDGYRVQSAMRRDIASWETVIKSSERQSVHAYMLYSDLFYQTPGALTKAQYDLNPRAARPGAGTSPGAVQNQAAIYQKTFLAGFSSDYKLSDDWQNTTAVYGAYTNFDNPGIRVYEKRKEPHFGGRSTFEFKKQYSGTTVQFDAGIEAQKGFFNTADYQNAGGKPDTLMTNDDIDSWQYMIFAQADLRFKGGWTITAGASFNKSSVQFTRLSTYPIVEQTQTFDNKVAPRLAILKKFGGGVSLYGSVSRGFSTPTVSELLKSSGTIGNNLQPEDGIDYEIGARGNLAHDRFYYDVNVFFFHLNNTIVQRIDTNGVYYYVNAGSTKQNGVETFLSYQLIDNPHRFFTGLKVWTSITFHDFHYEDFKQLSADYSGKQLPGVAPKVVVAGLDLVTEPGFYTNITYTYSDPIALSDANSDFATSFNLLGARVGYRKMLSGKVRVDIFGGVDNAFNTKYSLGNDINAAAGRYYNAAPGINYFGGISFNYLFH